MLPNIALSGKMGSGKSTCADVLMNTHGYRMLSFAAPLKAMVIEADPLVCFRPELGKYTPVPIHLSDLLDSGKTFEECKREYPEVRRALQRIGQGARKIDPDYWLNLLISELCHLPIDTPVVVPDVRYSNEAARLEALGFKVVRIERQHRASAGMTMEQTRDSLHASETALDTYEFEFRIRNDGSMTELVDQILDLVEY